MEGGDGGSAKEAETDEFHEKRREVIKNEMKAYGEDTLNNNEKGAKDHLETAQHVNEEMTKADMDKVKNSPDPSAKDLNNLAADHYTGTMIGGDPDFYHEAMTVLADGMTRSSSTSEEQKDFWSKVKDGRTPNPDWDTCDHPVCKSAREYTKDIREVLNDIKKAKIGKGGLIGGRVITEKGPTPSKTYPGESAKSGFRKEKESKASKGGQIINPSGERGTGHPAGFDFCGRHLPSPEEYARMGFDPGKITDPVDRSWNGRIEQVQNQRTLVWSKAAKRADGSSLKIERRYKEGSISSLSYQLFDKKGEKIGYINYDSKTGKIDGVRLR